MMSLNISICLIEVDDYDSIVVLLIFFDNRNYMWENLFYESEGG
jgi:hypothetical protein